MKNMNKKEYLELVNNQEIEEDLNPALALRLTCSSLLIDIAKGEFNLQEIAKRELESRGLNIDGAWVGFGQEIQ